MILVISLGAFSTVLGLAEVDGYNIGDVVSGFSLKNIDDNYQDASKVEGKFVESAVDAMLTRDEIAVKTT